MDPKGLKRTCLVRLGHDDRTHFKAGSVKLIFRYGSFKDILAVSLFRNGAFYEVKPA